MRVSRKVAKKRKEAKATGSSHIFAPLREIFLEYPWPQAIGSSRLRTFPQAQQLAWAVRHTRSHLKPRSPALSALTPWHGRCLGEVLNENGHSVWTEDRPMAMTVEELSRRTNVSANTVRYYTRIGLLEPGRHPANGYRLYDHGDVTRLRFIVKAKWLGLSLSEIRRLIECSEQGESSCKLARRIIERRIVENRHRIDALRTLQLNMESALAIWEEAHELEPTGRSICYFIESIELGAVVEPGPYAANELPNGNSLFALDEPEFQAAD